MERWRNEKLFKILPFLIPLAHRGVTSTSSRSSSDPLMTDFIKAALTLSAPWFSTFNHLSVQRYRLARFRYSKTQSYCLQVGSERVMKHILRFDVSAGTMAALMEWIWSKCCLVHSCDEFSGLNLYPRPIRKADNLSQPRYYCKSPSPDWYCSSPTSLNPLFSVVLFSFIKLQNWFLFTAFYFDYFFWGATNIILTMY